MQLIPLLLLGYGATLLKGSNTADRLEYYPQNVYYSKTKKTFVYKMEILNPTKNKLKIDSVFAGLFINDTKAGSIEVSTPFTIEALGRTTVEFPVKVIGLGLGQAIASLIKNPTQPITLKVLGTVRALGIESALNEELPLTL